MSALVNPSALTLVSAGHSLAKRITVIDGIVCRVDAPHWPRIVKFETIEITSPDDLFDVLVAAARETPAPCVVRADPLAEVGRRAIYPDPVLGPAGMRIMPRAWVGYDFEKIPADGIDPLHEPFRVVAKARSVLPPEHHDTTVVWQLTASAGKRANELRIRLWFLLDRPMLGRQLEAWCAPAIARGWLDPCTLRNEVLPHFVGVEIVGRAAGGGGDPRGVRLEDHVRKSVPDPAPYRWGAVTAERARVPVPDHALVLPDSHRFDGAAIELAGNELVLRERLGSRYEHYRKETLTKIGDEFAAVRAAGDGARHPTYLRAAARIKALCDFWSLPLDPHRAALEAAYLATLSETEARQRERGSTKGVWQWLDRRSA